jgi:hypothetical protein
VLDETGLVENIERNQIIRLILDSLNILVVLSFTIDEEQQLFQEVKGRRDHETVSHRAHNHLLSKSYSFYIQRGGASGRNPVFGNHIDVIQASYFVNERVEETVHTEVQDICVMVKLFSIRKCKIIPWQIELKWQLLRDEALRLPKASRT